MENELLNSGQAGFALALQILGNRQDAMDVLQDSVQKALTKKRQFNPERGTFRSWFLSIVRSTSLDLLRKPQRREVELDPNEFMTGAESDPSLSVERKQMLARVATELAKLSLEHREIILMKDYHGMNYAEISESLGIAKGTVMSRLSRARSMLRENLKDAFEGGPT